MVTAGTTCSAVYVNHSTTSSSIIAIASHNDVSPSTTLAPTPRRQRLTTVDGWCDTIVQPLLSRFSSRHFCFQAFLWHKNAWMAKFGILGQKPAANTPQSGHRSASYGQLHLGIRSGQGAHTGVVHGEYAVVTQCNTVGQSWVTRARWGGNFGRDEQWLAAKASRLALP